jgi:hypothetical protein
MVSSFLLLGTRYLMPFGVAASATEAGGTDYYFE